MNEAEGTATWASTTAGGNTTVEPVTPVFQPEAKKTKKAKFTVDDNVKYFDKKTGKTHMAVIVEVAHDEVSAIGVQGPRLFHIKNNFLAKC